MLAGITMCAQLRQADACGCVHPPETPSGNYAVNQRAEQIVFETEPGYVTAHILINYSGTPASFAWIVPVPEAPEIGISPVSAFAMIDQGTAPIIQVQPINECPQPEWSCRYHDQPTCGGWFGNGGDGASPGGLDAGTSGDASGGGSNPPVTVISTQRVGDYQTVTFRADQAGAATQWLRDNGFIVNPTMSIYMEPYINAGMVFVAAKLVPGAGVDAIRPIKLRYHATYPMVPLVLTAIASEPNLTVTSYIFSDHPYRPQGHPMATIDPTRISQDAEGRTNYPMVVARTVDEAGGDAFVREYSGSSYIPNSFQSGCCASDFDVCNIGNDTNCQCPLSAFDMGDCVGLGDARDGVDFLNTLASRHNWLTRLTTRISAEEMTFDPQFEPDFGTATSGGQQVLNGQVHTLAGCTGNLVSVDKYAAVMAQQECSSVYCGPGGRCVGTDQGAACACDSEHVAQQYMDLDNKPSIACVPTTPPVDLRAGGAQLPDACAGVSCGEGTCIDRNGVAVCECEAGTAALPGAGSSPSCANVTRGGTTPGAQDYSAPLHDLEVCAPAYPVCGEGGWLEKHAVAKAGVACVNIVKDPPAALTVPGDAPTCDDGLLGCGGCSSNTNPVAAFGGVWVVGLLLLRRRRGARR
ncbi:hypothetical protein BH11MYX2_BH11MYX2_15260 [soil metagenome]